MCYIGLNLGMFFIFFSRMGETNKKIKKIKFEKNKFVAFFGEFDFFFWGGGGGGNLQRKICN